MTQEAQDTLKSLTSTSPNAEYLGAMFAQFADMLIKGGQGQILDQREPKDGPQSVFIDPWQVMGFTGARQKPTVLTFQALREMSRSCKPVAAIVLTRQNQAAKYCRSPRFRGDIGFRIRMRDMDAKPSSADRKRILEIHKFLLAMGSAPAVDPNGIGKRPGFEMWVRMMVRDSLTLDAVATEPRRTIRNDLFDLWPIDAATIRYAGTSYEPRMRDDGIPVAYLQEYMGEITAEYAADELSYAIRNPRTDIMANGYGYSELEILIETVTALLNSDSYNSRYFTQNSLPEGILSVVGNLSQANLDAFRRSWNAQVSGVTNAWKVPIIATPDGKGVSFTPFKLSNKDMQFAEYQNWLLTIACAIYQIDPKEIGFDIKMGGGSSLSSGSDLPTLQQSQSKGFSPLMTFLETYINEAIIWPLDDQFSFAWEGVDPDREQVLLEMMEKKMNMGVMTPRMYWKEMDIEDTAKNYLWPDCPINPQLANVFMQESGVMNPDPSQEDDTDEPGQEEGDKG